jgi:hypothetical protein
VIGMDQIIETRRAGLKPASVFVGLVTGHDREYVADCSGGVYRVEVLTTDRLADLDLRPLVGLTVFVNDWAGEPDMHRELARLVALAKPAQLVMPVETDAGWRVHRLLRGETTSWSAL